MPTAPIPKSPAEPPVFAPVEPPHDDYDVAAPASWERRFFGDLAGTSRLRWLAVAMLVFWFLIVVLAPLIVLVRIPFVGLPTPPAGAFSVEILYFSFVFNTIIFLVLPVVYFIVIHPKRPRIWLDVLRLRITRATGLHVLIGVGATLATLIAAGLLVEAATRLGLMEQPETSTLILDLQANLTWELVLLIPIVSSITEEVFFRGFLQPRVGILPASILFALVHLDYGTWLQVVGPFVLALLFGYLYIKTRSLWTPIAGHFAFNLTQVLLLKFGDEIGSVGFLWPFH